ncbi:MAG TPA: hypothetical protein VJR27_05820 [Candidatus Saccharimonadales bacterium]|nr:hypothetical protein [Candidatus Saccharimonadales bacterium]
MTEISPLEQAARNAHHDYMSWGADPPLGGIDTAEMQSLVTATDGLRRWPGHQALDVGWLCLETALRQAFDDAGEAGPSGARSALYSQDALVNRAQTYWDKAALDPANNILIRSRARWAIGAVQAYMHLATLVGSVDLRDYQEAQTQTASMLLREYGRRKDPGLLHDLHVQTVGLLLSSSHSKDKQANDLALPLPTRFQEQGSPRRSDMLFWKWGDSEVARIFLLGVSSHEGTNSNDVINIAPALLQNDKIPSKTGQGTLEAMDTLLAGEKAGKYSKLQLQMLARHFEQTAGGAREVIEMQIVKGMRTAIEIDPEKGLQDAYDWYAGLGPTYHMKETDKHELEQAINPFEMAAGNGDADLEDLQTLAWLWMEVDMATGEKGGFSRAEEIFEYAAQMAEVQENWPAYCASKLDKATASFRRRHQEPDERETALENYQQDLYNIATGMVYGLAETPQTSQHYVALQRVARRLVASLLFADGEEGVVVFTPSTRQRGVYDPTAISSDILMVPEIDDEYPLASAGKVRFSDAENRTSLDEGVATLVLRDVWGKQIQDFRPLLEKLVRGSAGADIRRAKRQILAAAQDSMDAMT